MTRHSCDVLYKLKVSRLLDWTLSADRGLSPAASAPVEPQTHQTCRRCWPSLPQEFHDDEEELQERAAVSTYLCGKVVVKQAEGRETACNPAIMASQPSRWGVVIGQAGDLREWTGRPRAEEREQGSQRKGWWSAWKHPIVGLVGEEEGEDEAGVRAWLA